MLERLNDVPWSQLTHAYGPATDVPELLVQLAGTEDEQAKALWSLYGNIFHQGTRYQATPFAVPFLEELIQHPATLHREKLVLLLVHLALGYESYFLPQGLDPDEFRRQCWQDLQAMDEETRQECEEYGFGPQVELDCYVAVQQVVPTLAGLLEEEDEALATAAAYALAWFPDPARQFQERLLRRLDRIQPEDRKATWILSIGLLARGAKTVLDDPRIASFLESSSMTLRTAAAIALARAPFQDEILSILIEAVSSSEGLRFDDDEMPFNQGDLAGYAAHVLADGAASEKERVVPALCDALSLSGTYHCMGIASALLQILTRDRSPRLRDTPCDQLAPLEREALQAIALCNGWGTGNSTFGNFCQLMEGYGLPRSRQALEEYLGTR